MFAGKDWRQEEKGMTEYTMVGWHQWLNGHEFEQALGVDDGQGNLACCSPWGHKELNKTEQLNWLIYVSICVYVYMWLACNIILCIYIIYNLHNYAIYNYILEWFLYVII